MSRTSNRLLRLCLIAASLLCGCTAGGDIRQPIPTARYPAPQAADRLVVFLPGRGDSLTALQQRDVAQQIQRQWPKAEVILTGLTMPFYREGRAAQRLHDEVIAPALSDQDRPLWLAGISLGGLGALLYDDAFPDSVDGLILLSPYLGEGAIHDEIRDAGGIRVWSPVTDSNDGDDFERQLWRHIRHWQTEPDDACRVWVVFGNRERFREPIELMTPLLPPSHALMQPGKHNWALWTPTLDELLKIIDTATTSPTCPTAP